MSDIAAKVKVIAFDVFGTVVDWHGSLVKEIDSLQIDLDSSEFALAWRAGYAPAMRSALSLAYCSVI